ncbi:HAD-IA family hydrolase [Nocardioides sp.]|uniref:HAD-IA family hydrolase n=1 Tax=Nocardioides sp. TaxID=35761 RepID=UPI0037833909
MAVWDVRAILWDADGVLQETPAGTWDLAVEVVHQFEGALTGAHIDERSIRTAAVDLGLGDRVEDILSVWWTFDVVAPTLEVVARAREAGVACYLATNQDSYRATCMREKAPYAEALDGSYYSCDVGHAKPSAGFFEHILDDLALAPGQVLFIDDQPKNVEGARAVGLRAERWTQSDGSPALRRLLAAHGLRLD